jgi:flagellar capping protein FliD
LNSSISSSGKDPLWAEAVSQFSAERLPADSLSKPVSAGDPKGLSSAGRNLSLFDPESAYKMMSVINGKDVSYKAQFSELNQMKSYLTRMQDAGQRLAQIDGSTSNEDIDARLQSFVGQYNDWVERFAPDMNNGGLLAGTQAAQVSRYELDQSVKNMFNGAKDGVHGLADLGVTVDQNSGLLSLDSVQLDSLLTGNRQGGVNTLQEFSANFSKSASLLNSAGNFIPNQLNNLSRVIDYFSENKVSLQQEFGTGDLPTPRGQIAQALAAYNQQYGA